MAKKNIVKAGILQLIEIESAEELDNLCSYYDSRKKDYEVISTKTLPDGRIKVLFCVQYNNSPLIAEGLVIKEREKEQ